MDRCHAEQRPLLTSEFDHARGISNTQPLQSLGGLGCGPISLRVSASGTGLLHLGAIEAQARAGRDSGGEPRDEDKTGKPVTINSNLRHCSICSSQSSVM